MPACNCEDWLLGRHSIYLRQNSVKKFILLLIIVGGVWYWQKGGFAKIASVDANGNPVVVIYTTGECGYPCRDAVHILNERGVPFQEKEINPRNADDEDVKLWRAASNGLFPLTLYGNSKVIGSSKWELISLLGDYSGNQYLLPAEQGYFQRHFDVKGSPMVVLYGTSWCPGCAELRKQFSEHGVSYVDIDVEKSGEFDKMTKVMEIGGYPAVWVGYTRVHGTQYGDVMAVANSKT
jgi:glutaredoxin